MRCRLHPPAALVRSFLALMLAATGCGYRLVGAHDRPTVRLGVIDDLTAEGDLGLWAREHLRQRVLVRADAPVELRGRVRPGDDRPSVHAVAGERLRAVGVIVELTAVDAQGSPLAVSGPIARSRPLAPSADPIGAEHRRQTRAALGDALDDALDRLRSELL